MRILEGDARKVSRRWKAPAETELKGTLYPQTHAESGTDIFLRYSTEQERWEFLT